MSGNALRDLNVLAVPGLERKSDGSSKGSFIKPYIENSNEEVDRCQKDSEVNIGNNGVEAGNSEVEYIESENLTDLPDVDSSLNTLLARLDSKDWVSICEALNNVRQLSIYHKEELLEMLGVVIPLIVRSLKNPRSAVCKTAIMTCADIFKVYSDSVVDSFDPLPYLKSKNPRVRAKASMCFSRSVSQLGLEGIKAYGIDNLIQIAASQLSDQLPESREAARMLALELRAIYDKSHASPGEDCTHLVDSDSWEAFCQTKLSPLSANAILRVTSTPKEGLVFGC
ncbi:uncharacterized protein LOC103707842 isoform X2 [Phoenix dactylifera]|uniref:Uncharacterized protein LOC103707842 isoform X2 n=1 Tax=Phoenix dactylifera TaxID=42345 RepID=A0A8B8J511_PHODC|nr:uncharacterized protein LOC103707842 isoform X2 [Phoenix dactylifera]